MRAWQSYSKLIFLLLLFFLVLTMSTILSLRGGANHGLDAIAKGNVAYEKGLLVFRTYFLVKDWKQAPGKVAFYGEKKCRQSLHLLNVY